MTPETILRTVLYATAGSAAVVFGVVIAAAGVCRGARLLRRALAQAGRRGGKWVALALASLALVCCVVGQKVNTNSPANGLPAPRLSLAARPESAPYQGEPGDPFVTDEDVARGWRVVDETDGVPAPMPPGMVTNEHLRLRGGFDDVVDVTPPSWTFTWRDGFATGVTVFTRGEVQPNRRTSFFPTPVPEGVSLLPEARWNLVGGPSVFAHALTPSNSLLLAWWNALAGRDANCPTNLQMELFADGRFAWRTDAGTTAYDPVLPFDWDGDGLENSVDPDPRVAGPDAHGTNAEWYRIVCSNVFETVEEDGVPSVVFREGVNTNAYYFVDVVAERGPVPISFMADRDSRLGSPVVVAQPGETNHVPLLIGVEYAATSTVPFSVSLPEGGYAEIAEGHPCDKVVRCPLEFVVEVSDNGHSVLVTPVPCDPGGAFAWQAPGDEDEEDAGPAGAPSNPTTECMFFSFDGLVAFDCGGTGCTCGGCYVVGSYWLEGASWPLPTVWCGCSEYGGGVDPEAPPTPHSDRTSAPSVTASFSEPAVLFEGVYTNAPGNVVPRQSTTTTLTVSAYGGSHGAYLTIVQVNVAEKLIRRGGQRLPNRRVLVPANSDISYAVNFEGFAPSSSRNDIVVLANLVAVNAMSPPAATASVTCVRLAMEAESEFPTNRARHVFGPAEKSTFKFTPAAIAGNGVSISGDVPHGGGCEGENLSVGMEASSFTLSARCGEQSLPLSFSVIEPSGQPIAVSHREPSYAELNKKGVPLLAYGFAGLYRVIEARILPSHVSFGNLMFFEGTTPAVNVWGCCTNMVYFPPERIAHGVAAGGTEDFNAEGMHVRLDNVIDGDLVSFMVDERLTFPCSGGGFTLMIPWKWCVVNDREVHDWTTVPQVMTILPNGTATISKYGLTVERTIHEETTWHTAP